MGRRGRSHRLYLAPSGQGAATALLVAESLTIAAQLAAIRKLRKR